MLSLGSKYIGTPVMSLQTGLRLGVTSHPLIDPANLIIAAYEIDGPRLAEKPSFVRLADIREISRVGMIVDSSDEIIGLDDVINIKSLYELGFKLVGMPVIDEAKHKLGRVSDYTLDDASFAVQQLVIGRRAVASLVNGPELLIHRSQIIEINDKTIIVKALTKKLQPIEEIKSFSYINPFRSTRPESPPSQAEIIS